MTTPTLTALLPLLALLLPLGAVLKAEHELGGWQRWGFGRRVRTREELRRSLRVIPGGLLGAESATEARPSPHGASFGS